MNAKGRFEHVSQRVMHLMSAEMQFYLVDVYPVVKGCIVLLFELKGQTYLGLIATMFKYFFSFVILCVARRSDRILSALCLVSCRIFACFLEGWILVYLVEWTASSHAWSRWVPVLLQFLVYVLLSCFYSFFAYRLYWYMLFWDHEAYEKDKANYRACGRQMLYLTANTIACFVASAFVCPWLTTTMFPVLYYAELIRDGDSMQQPLQSIFGFAKLAPMLDDHWIASQFLCYSKSIQHEIIPSFTRRRWKSVMHNLRHLLTKRESWRDLATRIVQFNDEPTSHSSQQPPRDSQIPIATVVSVDTTVNRRRGSRPLLVARIADNPARQRPAAHAGPRRNANERATDNRRTRSIQQPPVAVSQVDSVQQPPVAVSQVDSVQPLVAANIVRSRNIALLLKRYLGAGNQGKLKRQRFQKNARQRILDVVDKLFSEGADCIAEAKKVLSLERFKEFRDHVCNTVRSEVDKAMDTDDHEVAESMDVDE
jgi:hypothetical protein